MAVVTFTTFAVFMARGGGLEVAAVFYALSLLQVTGRKTVVCNTVTMPWFIKWEVLEFG